ncbi:hypothetical protein [uncultured Sphingomonas sp.]|uniref:hypothetical protein n=1 Tax=uncultured Sphingomonas sp. TaxID=158754 RepID=UPI0025E90688|nr:hypothetical protein [uncultured Sphingomonas sp.]
MRIVSQALLRPHVLQLPPLAAAARFRPLALKMLAWAGIDPAASTRQRARAIVGWFAAHAVHPQEFLHPAGTALNIGVLPVGETWQSYNTLFNAAATIDRDQAYWYGIFPDGITMLQKLVGTVAADGSVTDDGMLTEYAPGKWRIRSFAAWRAPQCTLQCKMAQVVLAAIGILSIDISTAGHDPMAFYEAETGRWLYIDPTFGEMLMLSGRHLTPFDAMKASRDGLAAAISGEKLIGASYIPVGYFAAPSTPANGTGMSFMTIHTAPHWAGGMSARAPYRFGDMPSQSALYDRQGTMSQLAPMLGVGIAGILQQGQNIEVRLRSSWPGHVAFQRSIDSGLTWGPCAAIDFPLRDREVRYRSVDASGFSGTPAILSR